VTSVAIGQAYATVAQLKYRLGIPDSDSSHDDDLQDKLDSASSDVNLYTGRQFGRDEVASTRTFVPGRTGVDTHDFWTAEDLAIVPYLGQTAGVAWTVAGLDLFPADGVWEQQPGWPFWRICYAYGMSAFYSAAKVKVTARWGWASVPTPVTTATLLLAAMDNKAGDAPFGVAGFGDYAVRVKSNPMAEEKLRPYVKDPIKVASS
jgi:hypothetical protein